MNLLHIKHFVDIITSLLWSINYLGSGLDAAGSVAVVSY